VRIAVRRYEDRDADAVDRLNARLERGGTWHRVWKEDLTANPDADLDVHPVNDSLYIADDGSEVRGGSWLREQYFRVEGERERVGWMKYPVSESLIDPEFAGVPASMIFQFLRLQPRLLALGMGGHDAPFARLLSGIRWDASTMPFLFRILRPYRVLRGLAYARRRPAVRGAMDLAAWSGLGWAGYRIHQAFARSHRPDSDVDVHIEERFAPWADAVWERCKDAYPVVAVRDGRTLEHVYPPSFPGLSRLRVTRAGEDVAWVGVQILPRNARNVGYFGKLRVGLVTDALARPEDAPSALDMAVRHLRSIGADLVIAYVSHRAWIEALRGLGFLNGPSNFAFYQSPAAAELFGRGEAMSDRCHFTRHTFGEDALIEEPDAKRSQGAG